MPNSEHNKKLRSVRRRRRVRGKVFGTPVRPRLTVNKSLKHVHVQIVNDETKITLVGVGSDSKQLVKELKGTKTERAKQVGLAIARLAKEKGIEAVVFDRNQYRYHGRIKAVADGAREGGLQF